jgi:hypothetical protein
MQTPFFVNTAMLCHNCRRVAVVRLHRSWRNISPPYAHEEEVLDIVLVSCSACISQGAHRPLTSMFPKYLDPVPYIPVTSVLSSIYNCTPCAERFPKFSLTAWRFKWTMRVYDTSEIFDFKNANVPCITILNLGRQIPNNCGFFEARLSWGPPVPDGSNHQLSAPPQYQAEASSVLCCRCKQELEAPPAYMQEGEKNWE